MWYSQVVSVLWKREWLPEEYRQENRNKNPTVSVLWKREWLPEEYRQENRNKNPTAPSAGLGEETDESSRVPTAGGPGDNGRTPHYPDLPS
ncbi:hypothetical protein NDU88_000113 [Pleurodeles waltl]|uniref:Uncharacterized protein n=1 Tax=Pleurodeles waltl TaxID=8319 RepID=A0AAV7KLI7_PLEWA|nr:hypothetical protein NDU88_000113 [Pleurodeles waltl]